MKKQIFLLVIFFISLIACSGGGGSFGKPILPNENFSVTTGGVNMNITANTFSNEMSFEFAKADDVNVSDVPSMYTIRSTPFQLHFSNAQIADADKSITLEITLHQDAPSSGLFALIKSEGNRVGKGGDIPTAGMWRPALGTQGNGVFTLNLYASAERQSVVIVSRTADANIALQAKNILQKNIRVSKAVDAGLFNRPWAIFCDRDNLSAGFQARCEQNTMGEIAAKFKQAAVFLESINVQRFNAVAADFAVIEGQFGAALVFSSEADPQNKTHNVAIVTATAFCEAVALGCYDFETQTTFLSELAFTNNARDSTIVHELMHAVQHRVAARAFNVANALWITEGTAEYISQGYAPGETIYGHRKWSEPLQKVVDTLTPYQTYKFFEVAFDDAGVTYAFLAGLRGNTSYKLADAGFGSLGELFTIKFTQAMQNFHANNKIAFS